MEVGSPGGRLTEPSPKGLVAEEPEDCESERG